MIAFLVSRPNTFIYLAVFRVYLALHILLKIAFSFPFYGIIYSRDSFVVWATDPVYGFIPLSFLHEYHYLIIGIYAVGCVLMMFGIGRYVAVAAVFVLTDVLQNFSGYVLDGGDNFLKILLLYMAFADSFRYLSLSKTQDSQRSKQAIANFLTRLSVWSILFHLCLIYFVSGISKANSEVWFSGVALYYIFGSERFMGTPINVYLAQSVILMTLGNYLTLIWEIAFPFIVWYRRLRCFVLSFGILLHIGIYVFMMIHEFQVLFIMSYGFFFSDSEWKSAWDRARSTWSRRQLTGTPAA